MVQFSVRRSFGVVLRETENLRLVDFIKGAYAGCGVSTVVSEDDNRNSDDADKPSWFAYASYVNITVQRCCPVFSNSWP